MPTPPASVAPADDYNAVPYPGHAFPATHPARLETLGRLHGLATPPADRCRVLELGCGDGANLIPVAYLYPDSRFVGVDLAGTAVARGRALIAAIGLKNIELHALDLCALPAELGSFDYVIAHGVYCWVPPAVADALLRTAGERLAPGGVAFVSYNTYPGHHLREMARRMMRYHTRAIAGPEQKVQQGVSLLKFLGDSRPENPLTYHRVLREEFERTAGMVNGGNRSVLFHDDLAEFNAPLYFHEFAARAAGHGLQFLCESQAGFVSAKELSPQALDTLNRLAGEPLEREQYLDFLEGRFFRQTLLRRADDELDPRVDPATFDGFHLAGEIREDDPGSSLDPGVSTTFCGDDQEVISSAAPLVKAALRHLAEAWPAALSFADLRAAAHAGLDAAGVELGPDERTAEEDGLLPNLLVAFHGGILELSPRPPPRRAIRAGDRPQVSAVARAQWAADWPVTNLCHQRVELEDPLDGKLIPLLDGTRDREALLDALAGFPGAGGAGLPGQSGPPARETLRASLETRLEELRQMALLVNEAERGSDG